VYSIPVGIDRSSSLGTGIDDSSSSLGTGIDTSSSLGTGIDDSSSSLGTGIDTSSSSSLGTGIDDSSSSVGGFSAAEETPDSNGSATGAPVVAVPVRVAAPVKTVRVRAAPLRNVQAPLKTVKAPIVKAPNPRLFTLLAKLEKAIAKGIAAEGKVGDRLVDLTFAIAALPRHHGLRG